MIITGPIIINGVARNSYSPFPKIVQIFPAGTPKFPVPVVFMVKNLQFTYEYVHGFIGFQKILKGYLLFMYQRPPWHIW